MKHLSYACALLTALVLSGCAFLNVDVSPQIQPLQEKVLEGEGKTKILILNLSGFISEKERSGSQLVKEKPSMVAEVKEALQKAERDGDIAGVILRINSPGGTVAASDIIYHEVVKFKEKRKVPVHACITGIGASGGYYIATAADRIFAHPTAVTGSIGVLLMKFNVEGFLTKVGVTETTFKSGDKKDILSPFRAATAEEEKLIQTVVNELQGRFLKVIEKRPGNKLSPQELSAVADGRIFSSTQALDAQLIDGILYLDDVADGIKKGLGIEKAKIISYFRPGSYKGSIYSATDHGASATALNIINLGDMEMLAAPQFMYLWRP